MASRTAADVKESIDQPFTAVPTSGAAADAEAEREAHRGSKAPASRGWGSWPPSATAAPAPTEEPGAKRAAASQDFDGPRPYMHSRSGVPQKKYRLTGAQRRARKAKAQQLQC